MPGVPAHTAAGALLTTADADGARRLVVDGQPVTPPGLQVRAVLDVDGDTALLSAGTDPCSIGLYSWSVADGLTELTSGPGVHGGRLSGGTLVVVRQDLDSDGTTTTVHPDRGAELTIPSFADSPRLIPRISLLSRGRAGAAQRAAAAHGPPVGHPAAGADGPLRRTARAARARRPRRAPDQPVVRRPGLRGASSSTGGARRGAGRSSSGRCTATWPARCWTTRSTRCTRSPRQHPDLDLSRVGIRGWSFGGYLAALAVLRRPDVFHAAVAGAPVTDWSLYDTHYTERYLGRPDTDPEAYARSSLIADAPGWSGRCCWCTGWPTTTWSPRTRCG